MVDNCKNKNPKSSSGFTPLHAAASKGHLEVVKLIFNKINFTTSTGPNEARVRCANVRRNSHSGYDEVGNIQRNQRCYLSKL